jgi:hypothetical protein
LSLTLITTPLLPLWIHFRLIDFDEDEWNLNCIWPICWNGNVIIELWITWCCFIMWLRYWWETLIWEW